MHVTHIAPIAKAILLLMSDDRPWTNLLNLYLSSLWIQHHQGATVLELVADCAVAVRLLAAS